MPAALLLVLCWPYYSSGIAKAADFAGATAEAASFGLPVPALAAALTITTQLAGSAAVVAGRRARTPGALALAGFTAAATLLAHAFWRDPAGSPERFRQAIVFGEHVGLVGAFLFVAWYGLAAWRR